MADIKFVGCRAAGQFVGRRAASQFVRHVGVCRYALTPLGSAGSAG